MPIGVPTRRRSALDAASWSETIRLTRRRGYNTKGLDLRPDPECLWQIAVDVGGAHVGADLAGVVINVVGLDA